jgi:hypothetical protein
VVEVRFPIVGKIWTLPVGRGDRRDRGLQACVFGFSAEMLAPGKQVVARRHNGLLCAKHGSHSFATSARLHHF